jgi:hypothetical protein
VPSCTDCTCPSRNLLDKIGMRLCCELLVIAYSHRPLQFSSYASQSMYTCSFKRFRYFLSKFRLKLFNSGLLDLTCYSLFPYRLTLHFHFLACCFLVVLRVTWELLRRSSSLLLRCSLLYAGGVEVSTTF